MTQYKNVSEWCAEGAGCGTIRTRMKAQFSKVSLLAGVSAATLMASAAFEPNRSVMSDAYWQIWNDAVQAKIDADIEK